MKKALLTMVLSLSSITFMTSTVSCFQLVKKPSIEQKEENNIPEKRTNYFNFIKSNTSFKDIAGYDAQKTKLNKVINIIKNSEKYAKQNVLPPKGIMFEGEPGTGKSEFAKAFAGEANIDYILLSGSEFDNTYVGVGAKNIREIYAAGRNQQKQCAIIIDEIDSIGRSRNKTGGGRDYSSPETLNQLLMEMTNDKNKNIILIATTNFFDKLDKALTRAGRFDIKLKIDFSTKEERKAIFELYANKVEAIKKANLDYDYLATIAGKMVGSDIKLIVDNVITTIITSNQTSNILQIFEEEIETIKFGLKKDIKREENEIKKTACLLSAAALVAIKTNFSTVHKISIIPRANKFGFISLEDKNTEKPKTFKDMKKEVTFLLAGRAYETLDDKNSDNLSEEETENYHKAVKLAGELVCKFSPLENKSIIENCLDDARNIITNSKPKIIKLADELIKQKSLSKDQILNLS